MSKYEPLWDYIKNTNDNALKMSFEEIKNVTGKEIDHSFLSYKNELLAYGFRVEKISLKEKTVIFTKIV